MLGRARALIAAARQPAGRYGAALAEQMFGSLLNFGLNLGLARLAPADQYGLIAFWLNTGFALASLQGAVTATHVMVLPPGDALDPRRLPTERLMHAAEGVFLLLVGAAILAATTLVHGAFAAPAAALFAPAFLAQQYLRVLAFSRGRPGFAAGQSGALAFLALVFVGALAILHRAQADLVLFALAAAYGLVAIWGAIRLCGPQWRAGPRIDLRRYGGYAHDAAWVFLGVSSSEVLTRFYSFIVAAWYGLTPLAVLSATQILLRPIPMVATTWGMAARPDLLRHAEGGARRPFLGLVAIALAGGIVISGLWSLVVVLAWPALCRLVFNGKYAEFAWMVGLWGVCAGLTFIQLALNTALQALRVFKALALANTAASVAAAGAILVAMKLYGYGGAVAGTAVGQALEVVVMAALLARYVGRFGRET